MLLPFYAKSAVLFDPQRFAAILPDVSPLAILLPWSLEIPGLAQEVGADWRTVRSLQGRSEDFSRHLVEGKNSAARKNIKSMAKLVSGIPAEETWKPLVRLGAARGQSWARCALRSMAKNPQTDPRVRIFVNEEESVKMGERNLCGMFQHPFYLVDILSKLRKMGVTHWVFEPHAREAEIVYPTNLALWELFLEMEGSEGLSEDILHATFHVFSKTGIPLVASRSSMEEALYSAPYLSMRNLLRLLPGDKTALQIVKRASFCGYASALLLARCLQKDDPLAMTRRVEERIRFFIKKEPCLLAGKTFDALPEEDCLALFALFPFFWGEYPKCSFEEFCEKLKIEMALPGLTEDSLVAWSRHFLDTLKTPAFFDHGSERHVDGHGILKRALEIHAANPLSPELVRWIRKAIGEAKNSSELKTFYCLVTWDGLADENRLRAALLLLEAGVRDIDTGLNLVRESYPLKSVRQYLEALVQYRKNRFPRRRPIYRENHPRALALRTAVMERTVSDEFFLEPNSSAQNRLRRKLLDPEIQWKTAQLFAHGYRLPPEHLLDFLDQPSPEIPESVGQIFNDPKILGRILWDDAHSFILFSNAIGKEVLDGDEVLNILSKLRADTAFVPWNTGFPPLPFQASPFGFSIKVVRTRLKEKHVAALQGLVREILDCRDSEKVLNQSIAELLRKLEERIKKNDKREKRERNVRELKDFQQLPGEPEKKIAVLGVWMLQEKILDEETLKRIFLSAGWNFLRPTNTDLEKFIQTKTNEEETQKLALTALHFVREFYQEAVIRQARQNIVGEYLRQKPEIKAELEASERTNPRLLFDALETLEIILKGAPQEEGEEHRLTFVPSKSWIDAFFAYAARNSIATPDYAIHTMRMDNFLPIRIMRGNQWVGSIMTFTFQNIGEAGQRFQKGLVVTGIDPQESYQPKPFLDNLLENLTRIAGENGYDTILIPENTGAQSSRHFLDEEILGRNWPRVTLDLPVGFPKKSPGNKPQDYYGLHRDFLVAWSKNG